MKLATGSTPAGSTNWVKYSANGIYVDVDTSSAGFSSTPQYITSLGGNSNHWTTTGASSIYNAAASGFRIYIYKAGVDLTPEYANERNWHINWAAFGE